MAGSVESVPNYEEQFSHRFTEDDKEYQTYLQRDTDPPPIVEEWKERGGGQARGRDNRSHDYRPYRGRDQGRSWSGDNRDNHHWQDRGWGQGRQHYHHQQGQSNSYNQGYNSYNQRPHNQRY
ncbi:RNA guanine-N7 methyltransferase-activating subunit-like protein [Amia ocellicauda]|uniref:RNA guanine-N7 methyltransferase-activating subunit-like protein n=1 Tax=Amia ocellicauda TaxID=2972642 RepID=UPI0034642C22